MKRVGHCRSAAASRMFSANVLFATIRAIAAAVDAKSVFSREHSSRVTQLCLEIGSEMGLPKEDLAILEFAAAIHDIGKIGTPESLLSKMDRLTEEDWTSIRDHPRVGATFLARIDEQREVATIIRHHHERMDGYGYPDNLRGQAIPLSSRILAVADAFEAMTADRPYRRAMSPANALRELQANAGEQFDPEVVKAAAAVIQRKYLETRDKRAA